MSCCGEKRRRFNEKMPDQTFEVAEFTPGEAPDGSTFFEYVGGTAMTVVGPATGRRYRFGWSGARVAVDLKDVRALRAVPNLRKVIP